ALIVIDEAYIDFSLKDSMVPCLPYYSNLVILRTLSKSFGLAGIRCGFVLAQKEIINILNTVISPYPISTPTSEIAIQALEKKAIQLMNNRI
ncbi:aminotransferase class I/II-fold pyridoxal phosphate-dependent enzyme, partial [Buchnera aphidicola]|nr:aminotransferase class I/II-fold pyridoxal phosphate-dependent enzyme [Buchnera aphidicola]